LSWLVDGRRWLEDDDLWMATDRVGDLFLGQDGQCSSFNARPEVDDGEVLKLRFGGW
jgi:hypothetical protein